MRLRFLRIGHNQHSMSDGETNGLLRLDLRQNLPKCDAVKRQFKVERCIFQARILVPKRIEVDWDRALATKLNDGILHPRVLRVEIGRRFELAQDRLLTFRETDPHRFSLGSRSSRCDIERRWQTM